MTANLPQMSLSGAILIAAVVMILALCVHWFNPMVWVTYLLVNRGLELSCDEGVIRNFGEASKAAYARTLIALEAKKSSDTPLCSNFSKNAIEERISADKGDVYFVPCSSGRDSGEIDLTQIPADPYSIMVNNELSSDLVLSGTVAYCFGELPAEA